MAIYLERGESRLRELLGDMKPAEFARRMGVHRSTVSKWMNNKREMCYEETVLGGRILNRHSEDFYEFHERPREKKKRLKE
jgi:transcriptional regulator with XRE-family HTH domain